MSLALTGEMGCFPRPAAVSKGDLSRSLRILQFIREFEVSDPVQGRGRYPTRQVEVPLPPTPPHTQMMLSRVEGLLTVRLGLLLARKPAGGDWKLRDLKVTIRFALQ